MMTTTIRYENGSMYKGPVDENFNPIGNGLYIIGGESFQKCINGICNGVNINIQQRMNGWYAEWSISSPKEGFNLTIGCGYCLIGNYVNGFLEGYGISCEKTRELIEEGFYLHGQKHGRFKDSFGTITHYEYDVLITIIDNFGYRRFGDKYIRICTEINSEEIIIFNDVRLSNRCRYGDIYHIGRDKKPNNVEFGIWRHIFRNGRVELGEINKMKQYKLDGTTDN